MSHRYEADDGERRASERALRISTFLTHLRWNRTLAAMEELTGPITPDGKMEPGHAWGYRFILQERDADHEIPSLSVVAERPYVNVLQAIILTTDIDGQSITLSRSETSQNERFRPGLIIGRIGNKFF